MAFIQGLLTIIFSFWMVLDHQGLVITTWFPIMVAFFMGLIMGDMQTAMVIGGTFQLMALGVASIGGASVPNWGLAALVGIYIAIRTTHSLSSAKAVALAVGVPVGMIGIQLDVLAKVLTTYVAHQAQKYLNLGKYRQMNATLWLGPLIFGLSTSVPTAIVVLFGSNLVKTVLHFIPTWVTNGLSIAGSLLPVLGIGMLLQLMPAKKYFSMLLVGFFLSGYLHIPMLGVSIIGFAMAYYFFIQQAHNAKSPVSDQSSTDKGEMFDE